ncbi:hypothetical protein D9619_004801 [Psilocybe cf. subviscida]|uniref:Uncharacterized protein n=1 Tax=Psilocybe cf. subviscida TaxID=2480587 RepID=A0A8H5BQ95_9AGAR|nr:hypothetical protein D9619_004801 [Psilocybe cf. subviscida]
MQLSLFVVLATAVSAMAFVQVAPRPANDAQFARRADARERHGYLDIAGLKFD